MTAGISSMDRNVEKIKQALKGKYHVKYLIASGGMGDIYLGEHETLKKQVAIKIVHQDLSKDEEFRQRFYREAKLAANLSHQGIIDIYDFGRIEGIDYIIMPYIKGKNLQTKLSLKGRFPLKKCLKYMIEMTDTLAFAHQHGVIHRDVKPSNFIIDINDRPVLTDFGISKDLADIDLTGDGAVLGSPKYMSPEQIKGEAIDDRSDIYSLGIVFYEMLTGEHPFEGKTSSSIYYFQVHETPKEPKYVITEIPSDLSDIIMKMIAKAPNKRYQCAVDVLKRFQDFNATLSTRSRIDIVSTMSGFKKNKKDWSGLDWTAKTTISTIKNRFFKWFAVALISAGIFVAGFYGYEFLIDRRINVSPVDKKKVRRPGKNESAILDALFQNAKPEIYYEMLVKEISSLGIKQTIDDIRLWTDKKSYAPGTPITFYFRSRRGCYVNLFYSTTEKGFIQLFPNKYQQKSSVIPNKTYAIPRAEDNYILEIDGLSGAEELILIAGETPFNIISPNEEDIVFSSLSPKYLDRLKSVRSTLKSYIAFDFRQRRYRYEIIKEAE